MNNQKKGLKIAMIGHKYIPSRDGGVEVVVQELASRMVQLGNIVTCYNRTCKKFKKNRKYKLKTYKDIMLKYVPTINSKGLAAISSSFIASIIASFGDYDVVHFHAEGPSFMCWLPRLFGKKVIVTIHGLDHKRAKWGKLASTYIMLGEKSAVKYADEIIVLSYNVQVYFNEKYNRKTIFIPNGVNRPKIKKASVIIDKYGLEKDEYLLFLGRLVPEKGLHYLIKAFKEVNTNKKLVIAGGSSDTDLFVNDLITACRDDKRIIFTGFVQGQILEELYSNAYIYLLPSDLEGMPLSLLEAMSYGNCCLTSDIDECVEVTEKYGVSFKKGDITDLKEKIENLCINESLVNQYKHNASDFICKKYNWDDIVNRTLNLYK